MKTTALTAGLLFSGIIIALPAWQNGQVADVIHGQSPAVNRISHAYDLTRDAVTGHLYVADYTGGRVLRYSSQSQLLTGAPPDAVFGKPGINAAANTDISAGNLVAPSAVAVDAQGRLWVADRYRILRWDQAALRQSGAPADAVLGGADFTSVYPAGDARRLGLTMGLAVDAAGNLFASCADRHSVVRFDAAAAKANGAAADAYFGQISFTNTSAGLSATRVNRPKELIMRGTALYINDAGNRRVLRLNDAATRAPGAAFDLQIGQSSFFVNDNQTLSGGPVDLSADGQLFALSATVQISAWQGVDALSGVLPAPVFTSAALPLNAPEALLCSGTRVWTGARLADFAYPGSLPVARLESLPSTTIASHLGAVPASTLYDPWHLAVDPVSGKVFVSDAGAHAIHRFPSLAAYASQAMPEAVFRRPGPIVAEGPANPRALCLDQAGRLYVCDTGNNRILRWDNAAFIPTLTPYTAAIGHPHSSSSSPGPVSEASLTGPQGICVDASNTLWVLDYDLARALRFDMAHLRSGDVPADAMLGKTDFADPYTSGAPGRFFRPRHMQLDHAGRLWVLDIGGVNEASAGEGDEYRLMRYDQPNGKSVGALPDATIKFISSYTGSGILGKPTGFAVMPDDTLIIAAIKNEVPALHWFPSATTLTTGTLPAGRLGSGLTGTGPGDLGGASGALSVDPAGNLWVADPANRRILRFSSTPAPALPADSVTGILAAAGSFQFSVITTPGASYFLESTTDLVNWTPLALRQTLTAHEAFSATGPLTGTRYFRVRAAP